MLMKGSQMVTINATTLKAILSGVGYTADSLDVDCAEVMTSVADVTGKHAVFFEVRNERGRKSKYLMPGLHTLAAMFSNLRGDKVFTLPDRQKIGI
jgi:hypothetical protein